jgi:hypothetical protein
METLSAKQLLLIEELKDDIEFYKDDLESKISAQRLHIIIGIVLAIGVAVILFMFPQLLAKLTALSQHADTVTGLVGQVLPVTFASKSFNTSKVHKKKLKGMRIFDKTLVRIERGILPNSEMDILEFENDLMIFINT